MKTSIVALVGLMILSSMSCSPLKIYSDSLLTKSTGFKYYTVKPYIQVEKDSKNGAIVNVTVLYLPDLANPQFMEVKGGLGSRKLDLELNNGAIVKFSLTSDTNIPETIEALATTLSKSADVIKDLALMGPPDEGAVNKYEIYEVIMDSEGTRLKKIEFK